MTENNQKQNTNSVEIAKSSAVPRLIPRRPWAMMRLLALTLLLLPGIRARAQQEAPSGRNYALQANDLVEILVFQEDDMHWKLRISKDGSVNLPLIGVLNAAHKSSDDLAAAIRDRLADGYLANPQVTVTVLAYARQRFTVLGQVNRPGSYDMPDNAGVTLVQAIAMAGGYTAKAAPHRILVKRHVNGGESVQRLDADRMAGDKDTSGFDILPGDTITVPESIF